MYSTIELIEYGPNLGLPYRYDDKIAIICNFWTFWHVIQLISHLFKIRQKGFLPNALFASMEHWAKGFLSDSEKMAYWLNYRPKCPEDADFCYFGSIPIR